MDEDDRAAAAADRMRALLDEAGLPPPDTVERTADEILLLWHDQKLAVVIELHDGA
jgi:hypothetical protein